MGDKIDQTADSVRWMFSTFNSIEGCFPSSGIEDRTFGVFVSSITIDWSIKQTRDFINHFLLHPGISVEVEII